MAWTQPMAQFSWTKAGVYAAVALALAAVLQAKVVLPGIQRWLGEERNKRAEGRLLEEYQLRNGRLTEMAISYERDLVARDGLIQQLERELNDLRSKQKSKEKMDSGKRR